jgi:Na+/melibiose symporter-like transporter
LVLGLLLLQNALFIYLFVLRNVAGYSITADITDEHESTSGKRQEGGFYSALAFTTKLASAAGPLYAGVALDIIGLSEGMMPGTINQTILDALVWVMAIGVIPLMLIAWYFTFRVSMSEEQLTEIQASIRARNAQASTSG